MINENNPQGHLAATVASQQAEKITQQLEPKIAALVNDALGHIDIAALVEQTIHNRLNSTEFAQHVDTVIARHLDSNAIKTVALDRAVDANRKIMLDHMPTAVTNVNARVDQVLEELVAARVKSAKWPDKAIDGRLINTDSLAITTQNIKDYTPLVGIEDFASTVQLTVLDGSVVVEQQFIAKNIQSETLEVEQLSVSSLDTAQPWYGELQSSILAQVPTAKNYDDDIELINKKIKRMDSNERTFKELDVSGEALLSDVLYTTPGNKRVGINTMDPSDALTVWDNEVEITFGKHSNQTAYIGTRRRQDVAIGANNTVGLVLKSSGDIVLDKPVLCGRSVSSAKIMPGYAARKGDIVLNDLPKVGAPVAWICIDGIKWAEFGTIN